MKKWKIGALSIAVLLVLIVGSFALKIVGKTVGTASKMADQTVFNADKHVYSYEEFRHKKEAFDQHLALYATAKEQITQLKAEAGFDRKDPEYKNLVMQKTGSMQMARNVAKEYNAMSLIAYQGIWKGKGMPKTLVVPIGM